MRTEYFGIIILLPRPLYALASLLEFEESFTKPY